MQMCRLIWVFAILVWGRDISHISVLFFFSKQQNPDQAAQMHRLIWVLPVLLLHRDIMLLYIFFFVQKEDMHIFILCCFFACVCDSMMKWSGNIQLFL